MTADPSVMLTACIWPEASLGWYEAMADCTLNTMTQTEVCATNSDCCRANFSSLLRRLAAYPTYLSEQEWSDQPCRFHSDTTRPTGGQQS